MRNKGTILFILAVILEAAAFVWLIDYFGFFKTLVLTLATTVIGIAMVQFEGRKAMNDLKKLSENGEPPGRKLVDGVCIMAGGALLVAPGVLTDLIGITLVFPLTRPLYHRAAMRWIEKRMKNGNITIFRR
ncbi:FxsA family protein [Saccharibacillus sp. CPCC 101409]|uniref:FxsA family protein n=1 Tax=Saccharibacillus sp. CPCC 101409 TaxID=3058041 RepID=UPI002673253D|nr:FxsA family protein [Saccharibacillus sp. CPCC 101409]MDO3408853.1 FxsA family protein [Saccharibacillus sp. CPCC 101409]